MSFRLYNIGLYLPVKIDNRLVYVTMPTGEIRTYKTTVPFNTKEDTVIMPSTERIILFVIEDNGIRYIGRPNGTISLFNIKDNMLLGNYTWEYPVHPYLQEIGAYYSNGIAMGAVLDLSDKRTIYTGNMSRVYIADKQITFTPHMSSAYAMCKSLKDTLVIHDEFGKEYDINANGHWVVQDTSKWQTDRDWL